MFDVITFGSATWDIFIRDKELYSKKSDGFVSGKGVFFPLGSKINIDEIHFFSGGGGTNSAASFSSQGIKTAYCGMLGWDPAGDYVIKDLKKFKISTDLILRTDKKATNHSIVLSVPGKDRTILIYKGASELLSFKDIPWNRIKKSLSQRKKRWFYLAPLSGKLISLFEKIISFAFENNIKTAVNPGNSQLRMPRKKLFSILGKTDVLILNREEASILSGVSYKKEKEIFKKIMSFYPGIFVMTKGTEGALISDRNFIYTIGILDSKVEDRTGAGDSFASGFVSGIIKGQKIEESIQLASANSTSCLGKWGAKNGLLKRNVGFKKIKIEKSKYA